MTAREIATCSGLSGDYYSDSGNNAVYTYAYNHGRHFPAENSRRGSVRQKRLADLKRAYWGGEHGYLNPHLLTAAPLAADEIGEVVLE